MKLLYVHTAEKVKVSKNKKYYTDGTYDKNVWDRYLKFAQSEVNFYTSIDNHCYSQEELEKKFNEIPSEVNVIVTYNQNKSLKEYFNVKKRKQRRKQIEELVKKSDTVIIRVPCGIDRIVIKFAKKYGKPYMLEVVGCIWDSLWNYNVKGKILAPFMYIKEKINIRNSKYVIYVTNQFLQKRYHTKGKQVNCSNVVLNNISDESLSKRIEKIKCKNEKIVIGTSAAIDVKYKGQDNVIKAISKLKNQGYNIEYQLIGNGKKDRLYNIAKEYGVEDNVKFIGSIPHKDVFDWLGKIDIYIQPSKQEGLPRALLEAMSMACPAIGTNIAGIPELLGQDCLFKKDNINVLCQRIKRFIDDKNLMIEQAKMNFNTSKEYDIKIINDRRFKFYDTFKRENFL